MNIPWLSTLTLFTELIVTACVLYAFYSGYKKNRFPTALIAGALIYETFVNVAYMVSRAAGGELQPGGPGWYIALAAFHGIFSLLMYLGVIAFMLLAWRNYRKGVNYFAAHPALTRWFIALWLIAILSGISFYFTSYVTGV